MGWTVSWVFLTPSLRLEISGSVVLNPPVALSGTTLVSNLILFRGLLRNQTEVFDHRFRDLYQATTFGNASPQRKFESLPYIPGLNYSAFTVPVSTVNESGDCTCFLQVLELTRRDKKPNKNSPLRSLCERFPPRWCYGKSKLPVVVVSICAV